MELLPTEHERSALLDGLARLIEKCGFETFVQAPLLEPSGAFFPDPWEPTARGVRALSLRLLRYAGLDEVDASVQLFGEKQDAGGIGGIGERRHEGTAAWFAGIDDGVCIFGADRKQLELGDAIVGTMCHEIAHAYREHHDVVGPHRQLEEEDTDVTTVYLGFGILTTNNAYRFRKSGGVQGGMVGTEWSTSQAGYLSPQSMAFLLAAQAVARGLETKEIRRIAKQLEPNQRDFFRAAHRELGKDAESLCLALNVPPRELWPEDKPFVLPTLPEDARFTPGEDQDEDDDDDDHPRGRNAPPWNHAATVFRVRSTQAIKWGFWGLAFGMLVAAIAAKYTEIEGWKLFVEAMPIGFVLGMLLGRRRIIDTCSEPRCETTIAAHDGPTCPKCGGTIGGVIFDPKDRLEFEEAIEEGRPVSEVVADLNRRLRRRRIKIATTFAILGGVSAFLMFSDHIPHPTNIGVLRDHHALTLVTVRLSGKVALPVDDSAILTSKVEDRQLVRFLLDDGTGTLEVWYDRRDGTLRQGGHVRLWGRFESMNVTEGKETKFERQFVASSISIDD